jgi:hypothetical protein
LDVLAPAGSGVMKEDFVEQRHDPLGALMDDGNGLVEFVVRGRGNEIETSPFHECILQVCLVTDFFHEAFAMHPTQLATNQDKRN